jgi:DNA-binding LacI/PurR family transcriptional regulator
MALLRVAHERQWRVGKDIDLMGYAGETALRNAIPQIAYLKIPYTEIGREACRLLYEKVTRRHNEIIHLEIPAHITNKRKGM